MVFSTVSNYEPDELTNVHDNIWDRLQINSKINALSLISFSLWSNLQPKYKEKHDLQWVNRCLGFKISWRDNSRHGFVPTILQCMFFNQLWGIQLNKAKKQLNSFIMLLPQSSLPFLMCLLKSHHEGETSTKITCILHNLECFFVRRAICGHEPSGLHAVFKGYGTT